MNNIADLFMAQMPTAQMPQNANQSQIKPQAGFGNMEQLVKLARENPEALDERLMLMAKMGIPAPKFRTAEEFIGEMQAFQKYLSNIAQRPAQPRQGINTIPGAIPFMPMPQGKPTNIGGM
jgi:hypothetical protein